jgi:hypothetical protein
MCIQTAMELLMRFTQGDSLLPGEGVGLTRRRAWMLGPCQPTQRDPQCPLKRKGNKSQGTFALVGGGKEMTLSKRLE